MWHCGRNVLLPLQRQRYGRHLSSSVRCLAPLRSEKRVCIGILREESNVWERRAPLAPHHVQALVKNGMQVIVQPSTRRAYSMFEYNEAGASLEEDLSGADVVLGVKAPTTEKIIANKTYAFFSHTIKAQEGNMPLLDACLERVRGLQLSFLVSIVRGLFSSNLASFFFVSFFFVLPRLAACPTCRL